MISIFSDIIGWILRLSKNKKSPCVPVNFLKVKGGVYFMGSAPHRQWCREYASKSGDVWVRVFGVIADNEGSSSAYQNYDNQKVTLGAGFGALGQLPRVSREINDSGILPLPGTDGKFSSAQIEMMRGEDFAQIWVCNAESAENRIKIFEAQSKVFRGTKSKYGFNTSNFPLLYLLCHLAHWYPGCVPENGWTGNDSVDVPRILKEFREKCAKYGITPKKEQIEIYLAKYRKLGGTYA